MQNGTHFFAVKMQSREAHVKFNASISLRFLIIGIEKFVEFVSV